MMIKGRLFGSVRLAGGALAGLLIAFFTSGAAAERTDVTIMTPPAGSEELVVDGSPIGTFPVFDGQGRLTFSWPEYWAPYWPTYPNPAHTNHSYKVAIWQNTTPLASEPTWVELHASHHWIDDPNPTRFTFDTFLDIENVCQSCPSMIVVQAETIQANGEAADTPYSYIAATAPNSSGVPAVMKSDLFLIEGYTRLQDTKQKCPFPPAMAWMCQF